MPKAFPTGNVWISLSKDWRALEGVGRDGLAPFVYGRLFMKVVLIPGCLSSRAWTIENRLHRTQLVQRFYVFIFSNFASFEVLFCFNPHLSRYQPSPLLYSMVFLPVFLYY